MGNISNIKQPSTIVSFIPLVVLVIFLAVNGIFSSFAVYRWSERVDNVPASNSFWEYVDERFPDERMERIYENMVFD